MAPVMRGCRPINGLTTATIVFVAAAASAQGVSQALDDARRLEAKGRLDTAIELLKRAQRLAPDDERLSVALAWAYQRQGNKFWALKTVTQYLEKHPTACASRALAVWMHLQMANLDQSEELLGEPGCDRSPEERARSALLRALLAEQRRDQGAVTRHTKEAQTGRVYAEDVALLDRLMGEQQPGRLPLVSSKVDLSAGYTSNGLAGSPVDLATPPGDRGSALIVVDARLRAVIPWTRQVRPVVTGQLRLFELLEEPARDLSYEEPTLRAGSMFGALPPRLLLSYAFDAVRLHGGDRYDQGPVWFSEAHRVEWEGEVTPDILVFGGLGERRFRDRARTRFETEQGLASAWLPHPALRLLGAVSSRWQQARADGWALMGGTVLGELDWAITPRLEARWNLAASVDWYPGSRGFFGVPERRRDLLERSALGLWFELGPGWQIGSSYELAHRNSTAAAYSFIDHRALGRIVWSFDTDRYSVVDERGRAPMQWSRAAVRRARDDSRIQELLRQDDTVKRGSSCLK
jgi:tetratricopeptide (TPR) repeat protein